MKLSLLMPCFALAACGGSISEDKFLDKLGREFCQLLFECAEEDDTEPEFNDVEECEEFWAGNTQTQGGEADCEYDGDAASECLDAIDEIECNDDVDSIPECEDVWSEGCDVFILF